MDRIPELKDFYNSYDPNEVTEEQREAYQRFIEKLTDEERKMVEAKKNFYTVRLKNLGGLVMPVVLRVEYEDGSEQIIRLPAEVWQRNAEETSTGFMSEKLMKSIELDPYREIADANRDNNHFPEKFEPSRFQLFKATEREGRRGGGGGENPMQAAKRKAEEAAKKKADAEAKAKADADKAAAEAKPESKLEASVETKAEAKAEAKPEAAKEKEMKRKARKQKREKANAE